MDRCRELRERAERYRRMLRSVDDAKTRLVLLELAQQHEAAADAEENGAGTTRSTQRQSDKPDN